MIDFDFIAGIGWRDGVLLVAAMLGVYLVVSVLLLFRVAGRRRDEVAPEPAERGFFSRDVAAAERTAPAPEFAEELARTTIELEVERLRREGAHLREEVARLDAEVAQLRATRNVSPLYNEAMALAQQGMPASGIAGHCGISIGEAELVAAMARSADDFDRHELDEDSDEPDTGSGKRFP